MVWGLNKQTHKDTNSLAVTFCFTLVFPVCTGSFSDDERSASLQSPAGSCSWGPAASGERGWSSALKPDKSSLSLWRRRMTACRAAGLHLVTDIWWRSSKNAETLCAEISSLHDYNLNASKSSYHFECNPTLTSPVYSLYMPVQQKAASLLSPAGRSHSSQAPSGESWQS